MGIAWLDGLLAWIRDNPGLAGLAIAAISFLEGVAFLGIIIPGILILFGVGALIGLGLLDFATVWIWASLGALTGDGLSFWIGHHFRDRLRDLLPSERARELLTRGELFFLRHGAKGVIIGRFLGPIRPVMPVVAGTLSMPLRRYVPAAIIAAVLWAPAYLLPGVVFGASVELARAVAVRLAALLCVVAALVGGIAWAVRISYLSLAPRASRMLAFALRWSLAHPRFGRVARNLVDPTQPESGTLALFGVLLMVAAWGLLSLLIAIPVAGGPVVFDQAVLDLVARLRTPWADPLMAALSGLGHLAVLAPGVAAVLTWLIWRRRIFAASHWIAAVGLGLVVSVLIGYLTAISRTPVVPEAPGEAVPLVHIGLSVVVYGFFAILIARELPRRTRIWPYAVAAVLVALIALARLYFGAHYPTDLLVGIFTGVAWITVLGIAYRTRIRRSFWTVPLAVVFYATIGLAALVHAWLGADRTIAAYTPLVEVETMDASAWESGAWIPNSTPAEEVDFQFAGTPEDLEQALADRGWRVTRDATLAVLLEMIQPDPDYDSMPLLPRAWAGRRETLVMQRIDPERPEAQTVLRLWRAPIELDDGRAVFVADVQPYEVGRLTWFFRYWHRQDRDEQVEAALLAALEATGYVVRRDGVTTRVTAAPGPAGSG